eukprot:4751771-Amphidinium_carterae.1
MDHRALGAYINSRRWLRRVGVLFLILVVAAKASPREEDDDMLTGLHCNTVRETEPPFMKASWFGKLSSKGWQEHGLRFVGRTKHRIAVRNMESLWWQGAERRRFVSRRTFGRQALGSYPPSRNRPSPQIR